MKSIAAPVIFLAMSAALAPAFAQAPRGATDNNPARLERLEQQVAELRGVVAAVETLAKNRRRRRIFGDKRRVKLRTGSPAIRADCGTDPAPAKT